MAGGHPAPASAGDRNGAGQSAVSVVWTAPGALRRALSSAGSVGGHRRSDVDGPQAAKAEPDPYPTMSSTRSIAHDRLCPRPIDAYDGVHESAPGSDALWAGGQDPGSACEPRANAERRPPGRVGGVRLSARSAARGSRPGAVLPAGRSRSEPSSPARQPMAGIWRTWPTWTSLELSPLASWIWATPSRTGRSGSSRAAIDDSVCPASTVTVCCGTVAPAVTAVTPVHARAAATRTRGRAASQTPAPADPDRPAHDVGTRRDEPQPGPRRRRARWEGRGVEGERCAHRGLQGAHGPVRTGRRSNLCTNRC